MPSSVDNYTLVTFLAISLSLLPAPVFGQTPPPDAFPVVGRVVFERTSKIATPVMGRIASLPKRVGDHVKKGEIVARIDPEQLEANLAVAQSEVLNARSALAVAEAQLVSAVTVRDRLAKLKKSPGFREATLEDASNRVSVAAAAVKAARSLVEVREAEAARQQVNLNLATVRAPFDGVVVKHLLTVGGLVSDYDPSILVMVDDSSAEIEIEVPIEYVSSISVGMDMTYFLSSDRAQRAKVRSVLPSITPDAETRVVRLEPENLEAQPSLSEVPIVTVYVPKHQG